MCFFCNNDLSIIFTQSCDDEIAFSIGSCYNRSFTICISLKWYNQVISAKPQTLRWGIKESFQCVSAVPVNIIQNYEQLYKSFILFWFQDQVFQARRLKDLPKMREKLSLVFGQKSIKVNISEIIENMRKAECSNIFRMTRQMLRQWNNYMWSLFSHFTWSTLKSHGKRREIIRISLSKLHWLAESNV